jgi:acyl-coenzyme A synthetase/AMP-(fatty) acid ligase
MSSPISRVESIRGILSQASNNASRFIWDADDCLCVTDLLTGTRLDRQLAEFSRRSVLIRTESQIAAALAMIELDGVARRMIICPPDLDDAHIPALAEIAEVDAVVSEASIRRQITSRNTSRIESCSTEWVLFTSGTTGTPRMVAHTLASLTAPVERNRHTERDTVWGTFYDIRRYGGLQVFLRAMLSSVSLVLSSAKESPTDHLLRLSSRSVTHLTGTPSHWRRGLMSPAARKISPRYVRLSGEMADQAILNLLRSYYPQAAVGHAFASTEAGVAFEVIDGLEGFPATFLENLNGADLKVCDSSLRIRSSRTAFRFIDASEPDLKDIEGFVDTGDLVELKNGRYHFLGRRSGLINVGGLKVFPEEIEAQLNLHPDVRISRIRGLKNPITGSLVVADIVLKNESESTRADVSQIKADILGLCRRSLPRHKVPAIINFVSALNVASTGKMARDA